MSAARIATFLAIAGLTACASVLGFEDRRASGAADAAAETTAASDGGRGSSDAVAVGEAGAGRESGVDGGAAPDAGPARG